MLYENTAPEQPIQESLIVKVPSPVEGEFLYRQVVTTEEHIGVFDFDTGELLEVLPNKQPDIVSDGARCRRAGDTCGLSTPGARSPSELAGELIWGEEAVKLSGIPEEVVQAWSQRAQAEDAVIAIRPVNQDAGTLLKDGLGPGIEFATKGLGVKGKSSDWGLQSGLIPYDAELSKKVGIEAQVNSGNANNLKAVNNGSAHAVQMEVSIKTVRDRIAQGKLNDYLEFDPATGNYRVSSTKVVNGEEVTFEYQLTPSDRPSLYRVEYKSDQYASRHRNSPNIAPCVLWRKSMMAR